MGPYAKKSPNKICGLRGSGELLDDEGESRGTKHDSRLKRRAEEHLEGVQSISIIRG